MASMFINFVGVRLFQLVFASLLEECGFPTLVDGSLCMDNNVVCIVGRMWVSNSSGWLFEDNNVENVVLVYIVVFYSLIFCVMVYS
jgi:hypothetical protein